MKRLGRVIVGLWLGAIAAAEPGHEQARGGRLEAPRLASREEVASLLTEVRRNVGQYTAYDNCTSFAREFHLLCERHGFRCRTVHANCDAQEMGHAFNLIQRRGGRWNLVEPQGRLIEPSFDFFDSPPPRALCAAMGQALNDDGTCSCRIVENSSRPVGVNTNPVTACAGNSVFRHLDRSAENARECGACCRLRTRYYRGDNHPRAEEWATECLNACHSHFLPRDGESGELSRPRANDTAALSHGRQCVAETRFWSSLSRYEQCRGCCYDGAQRNDFPRESVPTCMAVCRASYR